MTLWQRVVEANKPGPPEDSVPFRVASAGTVVVAVGACWSQGELSLPVTLFAVVATVVGNFLSWWRRDRPWPLVKPVLAVCAIGGFVWFIATVSHTATPGDISTVESPLAVLFAWVLCTHAFDVPARRDVAYSLAGSAALMAVAAAQSVDLSLGVYVVAWAAFGIFGLVAMWQSMAGTGGIPWLTLGVAGLTVLVVAVVVVVVLPAPRVNTSLIFPSASGDSAPVNSPSNLTDGSASLPAHAANPTGRIGVGGFLGFAKSLDTGVRATLGNEVVMRVRATHPSFWIGQTYDSWNGQSWDESKPTAGKAVIKLDLGPPFSILPQEGQQLNPTGTTDIQTFYLAQSGPNLVFHADQAERVYIQSRSLYLTRDGAILSSASMGAGTIYTVVSNTNTPTPAQLRASTTTTPTGHPANMPLSPAQQIRYTQLPHPYPRVAALTRQITDTPTSINTYDKVEAIEQWMSSHVRYTTDIPPLAPGADSVTSFLFGSRQGYCEQISTATVVMLRSLGIPAREAVGYVPGSYDPITDLYEVHANDAHAWVQVWFPGYGWQNFDPTAVVPLANPTPGSVLAHQASTTLRHLPWIPIVLVLGAAVVAVLVRRRRLRRPPTWAHQIAADLERGGARRGFVRRTDETLSAYGQRLDDSGVAEGPTLVAITRLVERYSYAGIEPSADEIGAALRSARRFRSARRGGSSPPAQPPSQEAVTANASSKEAPATSRGR